LILFAIIGGVFALFAQKLAIVLSTAFEGANCIASGITFFILGRSPLVDLNTFSILDRDWSVIFLFFWVVFAVAGVIVQYKLLSKTPAVSGGRKGLAWNPGQAKDLKQEDIARLISPSAISDVRDVRSHIETNRQVQRCPKCKSLNVIDARFCENCGHLLSISCYRCGKQLESGTRFCPRCGTATPYENGTLSAAPARASVERAMEHRCPSCGKSIPADGKFCDGCGQSLTVLCVECGEKLDADTIFCPKCGSSRSEGSTPTESGKQNSISSTVSADSHEIKKSIAIKKDIVRHKVVTAEECPHCGHGNQKGSRFCESCGEILYEECPKCTNLLKAKTVYCSFCGINIEDYNKSLKYEARGKEFLKEQKYPSAIKEFNLALQKRPESPELKELLQEANDKYEDLNNKLNLAKFAYEKEAFEEAKELLMEVQKLMHDPSEVDQMLTSIPDKIKERDFERFKEQWARAMDNKRPDKALSLAKNNVNRYGYECLAKYITKAEESDVDRQILLNLISAEDALKDKKYSFALLRLSFVLDKQPKHARALELKAQAEELLATKRRRTIRIAAILIASVAVIAIAVVLFNNWQAAQREKDKYLKARSSLAPQLYLTEYPSGKYSSEICQLQDSLIDVRFSKISQSNNLDSLRGFLNVYPNTRHTVTVQRRITTLAHTSAAYKEYLDRYPTGKHADEAYKRFKDMLSRGK